VVMATTFGIEEELLVVDAGTGDLVPRGGEVLDAARPALGELIVSELNACQVETNTQVCTTLDEASAQLSVLRAGLIGAGETLGVVPVPLASHPWSEWWDQEVNVEKPHYRELLDRYQQVARRTVICGCHLHVGVDDEDERILAMNTVTPWLPVFLALSANSPWWQGTDTGYASYRTLVWSSWPTATMPPPLRDAAAFDELVKTLQAVEAIDEPAALYWYVRPSAKLPTLEFRVADICLHVEDAVVLAGLARALTVTAIGDRWSLDDVPPTAVLDSALWRAARFGLAETLVDPGAAALKPAGEVVGSLIKTVALRDAGDFERVREGVDRIMSEGNGAVIQRRILAGDPSDHRQALRRICP
jgi:carboxylate-amine ligase